MDISELIEQLNSTYIGNPNTLQEYLNTIITSIKYAAESGSNTLVYELLLLSINDIQGLRNELLTLFPDMDVIIRDKRLIIDWS
jgi:hypothetical protein